MSDLFKSILSIQPELISAILGGVLGGISGAVLTYVFTCCRDKRIASKKDKDKLIATGNIFALFLALQQSELEKLRSDLEDRNIILQKIYAGRHNGQSISLDSLIQITQDFTLCKNINIDIEKSERIISATNQKTGSIIRVMQQIFLSNSAYFNCLAMLENYHEFKRATDIDKKIILSFINGNIDAYIKVTERAKLLNAIALANLSKEMRECFKVKINISTHGAVTENEVFGIDC